MKQPNDNNTIYTAALYLRLSKEDGYGDKDSVSIETQRDMLTRYCREHNIIIFDYYVDDGYSGKNFERPAFKRMIDDIETGKVNCVITKDQSRLGRNHLESDYYMEVFFPEHLIRYIAVNDNVDTLNSATLDIAPFRNLINDMYLRDVSGKIKSAILVQQKAGKYVGTKAPYGYKKDPNDKHHLLIDEKYAPVVRRIYSMYLDEGMGLSRIANTLKAEKVPRPAIAATEYVPAFDRYVKGDESDYLWHQGVVGTILRNPVYAGHIRGQNRPKISYKSEKRYPIGSVAFTVENMHEPIIEQERWDLVQKIMASHRKERRTDGYKNIFTGLLYCADCGRKLSMSASHRRKPRPNPIDMVGFQCNYYRLYGKSACTQHWIEARDLYEAVLEDIRSHARYALDNDEKMISEIVSKLNRDVYDNTVKAEQELRKAKARLSELDRLFSSLYEDKVRGDITDRNYRQLAASYESEQMQLEKTIGEYEQTLESAKTAESAADKFIGNIREYAEIEELTAAILQTLIEKIVIHTAVVENGVKSQEIEIYYKFVGKV